MKIKTTDFKKSLRILQDYSYDSFLHKVEQEVQKIIHSAYDAEESIYVWVPILYRLAMVDKALSISEKAMCYLQPLGSMKLNEYYQYLDADNILFNAMEEISRIAQESSILIKQKKTRKKSFFSLVKKGKQFAECLDLLGGEMYIDYLDFFSGKLCHFISLLKNRYTVVKLQNLLSSKCSYKYIPLVNVIIRITDQSVFQLKIKCSGFEGAELGVNYFEYKGYNIDAILLDDHLRLLKILYFREIEQKASLCEIPEILFNEIHNNEYLHLNSGVLEGINYLQYAEDIRNHQSNFEKHLYGLRVFF